MAETRSTTNNEKIATLTAKFDGHDQTSIEMKQQLSLIAQFMQNVDHSGGARGGRGGAGAPLTPPKISYCNLKGLTQEKERKKMTPWNLKVILTQGK